MHRACELRFEPEFMGELEFETGSELVTKLM